MEILPPSLFPPKFNENGSYITNYNKCDICKNYLISDNKFTCKVECPMLEVACLAAALMLFTLFLVKFVKTSI